MTTAPLRPQAASKTVAHSKATARSFIG